MGRLRGYLWLMAGLVVAALAGFVAFVTLSRATSERADTVTLMGPQASVVVAARTVGVRQVLTEDDVEVRELPIEAVPESALEEIEQVIGKITLVELYAGEVVMERRLLDPNVQSADGRTALIVAEDEVLMAFPAEDLMSRIDVLKPGDHVDFLFTFSLPINREEQLLNRGEQEEGEEVAEETEQVTFDLLQNVTIAAVVGQPVEGEERSSSVPNALLLTISPQDALVLKYVKDAGAVVDLVLRPPETEGLYPVESVDLEYLINGYIVPGDSMR